jgi:hypothetical protein
MVRHKTKFPVSDGKFCGKHMKHMYRGRTALKKLALQEYDFSGAFGDESVCSYDFPGKLHNLLVLCMMA